MFATPCDQALNFVPGCQWKRTQEEELPSRNWVRGTLGRGWKGISLFLSFKLYICLHSPPPSALGPAMPYLVFGPACTVPCHGPDSPACVANVLPNPPPHALLVVQPTQLPALAPTAACLTMPAAQPAQLHTSPSGPAVRPASMRCLLFQ